MKRRRARIALLCVALTIGAYSVSGADKGARAVNESTRMIQEYEASILMEVSPTVMKARSHLRDVRVIRVDHAVGYDASEVFAFQVRAFGENEASGMLGNFAVAKKTGKVIEVDIDAEESGELLKRIQKIIREEHGL